MEGNLIRLPSFLGGDEVLSFLMGIVTAIQSTKKRLEENKRIYKQKRSEILNKMGNGKSSSNDSDSKNGYKNAEKRSTKSNIMMFLTSIVAFFETLPVFLALMNWGIILLCVIILVVIIFILMALLKSLANQDDVFKNPQVKDQTPIDGVCSHSDGILAWTDSELASRGLKLTETEKNFYRLGVFARKAAEGYGGGALMQTDGITLNQRVIFLLGVSSTESSMRFYSGGKILDISKYPGDVYKKSQVAYGIMGINVNKTLASYYSGGIVSTIKSQYKPETSPEYDASYLPYGVAMSAKHHDGDFRANASTKSTKQLIDKIAGDWGIKANEKEFSVMTQVFLAQAEYHGASKSDYEGLIDFFGALFTASSTDDSKRSFSNWSLKLASSTSGNDFSESGIRKSFMGSGGKNSLDNVSTPTSLTGLGNTKVLLNGQELTVPVWSYLWSMFSTNNGMKKAWSDAQHYSAQSGGLGDRPLNFHYGFNSFLQAKRIELLLAKKMDIVGTSDPSEDCSSTTGTFKVTKGKSQAIIDGKPTESLIEDWFKTHSGSQASQMRNVQAQWGTSSFLSDPKSGAIKGKYIDKVHAVPFYGQSTKYNESYLTLPYVAGGNSFLISACMIYSYAYSASALTGKLINPAEMDSIIIASGGFTGNLVYTSKIPSVMKRMGLQAQSVQSGRTWSNFDATLDKGGVVVIRVTSGPEHFTSSEHFMVITGKQNKDGKTYYSVYTSSSHIQSMTLYTKDQLLRNMWKDALLVWK